MCYVSDRITMQGRQWAWRSNPCAADEIDQMYNLDKALNSYYPSNREDTWRCVLNSTGSFTVGAIREIIDNYGVTRSSINVQWLKEIPLKVTCFVWRALLGKIPSAEALIRRGVRFDSSICSLCKSNVECYNHILVGCSFAKEVWGKILQWCGDPISIGESVEGLLQNVAYWGRCPKKMRLLTVVSYGTLWCLWKSRNDRIFKGASCNSHTICDQIKALLYTWIKFRGGKLDINKEGWNLSPLNTL